ncbi:MAG TPA: M20/M25/M40 family metallo-hydrolase [Bryobacteraceae bacterium]|nr:M20/M25/M40 family metallo-hydrolase [Bryobacteraceae bacterium]
MPNSTLTVCLCMLATAPVAAQYKTINPQVAKIVSEVSEQHIAEIQQKLESFETRNIFSSQDNPTRGIGAARKWIYDQFRGYSPRLEVTYDQHRLKKDESRGSRVLSDVDLYNVVAVLPGTSNREERVIIGGHYDSIVIERPAGAPPPQPGDPLPKRDPDLPAPGVTDDGSGTACVLELARVLSQYEFEKTLVFIAFAGEEEGLLGSTLYAEKAHKDNQKIEAVLNNDIIGSVLNGHGGMDSLRINVFSEEPADSSSRELARYVRDMGARYLPSMRVDLVFRADRFGRSGDHTPFNQEGFAAVRFSSPMEDYSHQHSVTDTFANTSAPYIARVSKVNAAAAATLAWAPKPPQTTEEVERDGKKVPSLLLTRGKSRYDAVLKWKQENPEPDLAGYAVVMRSTTSPFWEHDVFVGNVTEYTLPDVSIDEYVFGVKAVDKDGNESLVAPYVQTPRPKRAILVE